MRRIFAVLLVGCLLAGCSSRLDLDRSQTQLRLGANAARINLWREALFRFRRAVEIDPANAMAHNNLAVALEGIGEFDKARAEYTEALRLERSNQFIQKNYSRFVEFYSKNKKREKKIETGERDPGEKKPEAAPAPETPSDPAPAPSTPEKPPAVEVHR